MANIQEKITAINDTLVKSNIPTKITADLFAAIWHTMYPSSSVQERIDATIMFVDQSQNELNQTQLEESVRHIMKELDQEKKDEINLEIINKFINEANFERILQADRVDRNESLDKICVQYLCENYTDDFIVGLKFETIKFLAESKLNTMSEIEVFKMIALWLSKNLHSETEQQTLLSNINFASLTPELMVKVVNPTSLLSDHEFQKAIVDGFDTTKNTTWRSPNKPVASAAVAIGYRNKSYYGYRIITNADLKNNSLTDKISDEYKKHNGFIVLDDISTIGLSKEAREINTQENHNITGKGLDHGTWKLANTQCNYSTNSVCRISFLQEQNNPPNTKITRIREYGTGNKEALFAFFVKVE